MPASKPLKRLSEKTLKKHLVAETFVEGCKFFTKMTDEQKQWALRYLHGNGGENDLLLRIMAKYAATNPHARTQLVFLSSVKPSSIAAQRADKILIAATA